MNMVGATGEIMVPLMSADTGSFPELIIGPKRAEHNIWLACRVPSVEDVHILPCGPAHDKASPRFDARFVVAVSDVPDNVHFTIHTIKTRTCHLKITQTSSILWQTTPQTGRMKAARMSGALLHPNDVVEIFGISRLYRTRNIKGPMPAVETHIPWQAALYMECRWMHAMPFQRARQVSSNPFMTPLPPPPMGPYTPS